MRKTSVIMMCMMAYLGFAQIGIGTTNVSSTLTVDGSIAGKYKEVSASTYTIRDDDYTIAFTGTTNNTVFTMPIISDNDVQGRMYNIKNLSSNKTIEIKSNVYFRQGGGTDRFSYTVAVPPNGFVSIVANSGKYWDINYKVEDVKKITSIRKVTRIWQSTTQDSEIQLNNLSMRFNYVYGSVYGYLQFKMNSSKMSSASVWNTKSIGNISSFRTKNFAGSTWHYLNKDSGDGNDRLEISKDEMSITYISLEESNELYKVVAYIKKNNLVMIVEKVE